MEKLNSDYWMYVGIDIFSTNILIINMYEINLCLIVFNFEYSYYFTTSTATITIYVYIYVYLCQTLIFVGF